MRGLALALSLGLALWFAIGFALWILFAPGISSAERIAPDYVYGASMAACCVNDEITQDRWPDQLGAVNAAIGGTTAQLWVLHPEWHEGHTGTSAAVILGTNSIWWGIPADAWEQSYRIFLGRLTQQFDFIQVIQEGSLADSWWAEDRPYFAARELEYAERLLGICADFPAVFCDVSFMSIDSSLKWDGLHYSQVGHDQAAILYVPEPAPGAAISALLATLWVLAIFRRGHSR